jgi:excisionase family DNA binding protein
MAMTVGEATGNQEPSIEPLVVKVWPDAGRALGLGRSATYDAVARGEIPVLRFGRRMVVSKKALARIVDGAGEGT